MRIVVIILGMLLGKRWKLFMLKKMGARIGSNINYLTRCLPYKDKACLLSIGSFTTISQNVNFIFHDGSIGPLINRNPRFLDLDIHVYKQGDIHIGRHVFIGHSAMILPGVHIGDYSVVGAGSVVTRDIPSHEIWGGVPAKYIKGTASFMASILKDNHIDMDEKKIESILKQ